MALKGIKVLEIAGLVPAPLCGMFLSDFGASVLRVDKMESHFVIDTLDRGKKSIALNLKQEDAKKVFKQLAMNSDVLIEPFRKGVMENLGLGPEILMKDNPKLIYARLTGFGQSDGEYSRKAGHDINYIALSGVLSMLGRKGEKPSFPVNFIADMAGGSLMCAFGILLALYERQKSGLGQIVDTAMTHGASYIASWFFLSKTIGLWDNERGGNLLDGGVHFYEVYQTKDGKYMSVGAFEPKFYRDLLKGLELDLNDFPQFGSVEKGKEIFTKKFAEKTQAEWVEVFRNLDACVVPILSLDEASKHPHNAGDFTEVNGNSVPKPAPNLSRTPGVVANNNPQIGEHTVEILRELGYSDSDIERLENAGSIRRNTTSKL